MSKNSGNKQQPYKAKNNNSPQSTNWKHQEESKHSLKPLTKECPELIFQWVISWLKLVAPRNILSCERKAALAWFRIGSIDCFEEIINYVRLIKERKFERIDTTDWLTNTSILETSQFPMSGLHVSSPGASLKIELMFVIFETSQSSIGLRTRMAFLVSELKGYWVIVRIHLGVRKY